MVLPVVIILLALLFLYGGIHNMTVIDALRSLLGKQPKGPLTPTAQAPTATTSPGGGGSPGPGLPGANPGSIISPPNKYGLVNPVPGATGSRLDQGMDLTSNNFLAPYDGTVVYSSQFDPGWNGGGYIAIADAFDPSFVTYFAEGISPTVFKGQTVKAGQRIGVPVRNPYNWIVGNIEIGLANPDSPGQPLAQVVPNPRQVVLGFYNWLRNLGGPVSTNTSGAGYP